MARGFLLLLRQVLQVLRARKHKREACPCPWGWRQSWCPLPCAGPREQLWDWKPGIWM